MNALKNTWKFLIVALVVLSASTAAMGFIRSEQQQYDGVCSSLTGVPGLLQKAGLFQAGTCVARPGGALCDAGNACKVSGKTGTCKNTARPGGSAVCACIANVSN